MKFAKNYDAPTNDAIINNEPSMVRPEFEAELEINNIMDRYVRTGYMPLNEVAHQFGDFAIPLDFDMAQQKILEAQKAFINLPLEIRDEFRTAESLINAFSTDLGKTKLLHLGVLEKRQGASPEAPETSTSASAPPETKPSKKTDAS